MNRKKEGVMIGPGKYDQLCTSVRVQSQAKTAIILIINGNKGSGFSMQTSDPREEERLPAILRTMADQIESDMKCKAVAST